MDNADPTAVAPASTPAIRRAYYSAAIAEFLDQSTDEILGVLVQGEAFAIDPTQLSAWVAEIEILKASLGAYRMRGKVYFEFSVPRLGKRIDALLAIDQVLFILEFKVGEKSFVSSAIDQVFDYALDLKNFHETSHDLQIAPVLVATESEPPTYAIANTARNDGVLMPIFTNSVEIGAVINQVLKFCDGKMIDITRWELGRYHPTPTIVEAAMALYSGHSVNEISRSGAGAVNLTQTANSVSEVIKRARECSQKSICFVTGVPGAGKTLVGLKVATDHIDKASELYSVFLSGNGPLVTILREALARDKVRRESRPEKKVKKGEALSEVKMFIQNVHHFRDECLKDISNPPIEHVALFDEAQRAWNLEQTASFMKRKKGLANFNQSEPEFLISCLDRHKDWAVIVCLVGGGQEINTGEAGIGEWIDSLNRSFPDWHVHISPELLDGEFGAGDVTKKLQHRKYVQHLDELHLAVSMRSFRADKVSALVKSLLDLEEDQAKRLLREVSPRFPIAITRNLGQAKSWLRNNARGTERYGMVVSSQAQRLKPHAIDVKSPIDPVHYFLDGKNDVRSSFYLEDVATEFHVQGLELDWSCVVWDADFRYTADGWKHYSFVGDDWNRINKPERKMYLKNAYRVLLTRARQGMVVVVPEGDSRDATRNPDYYDDTFQYLKRVGFQTI